MMHYFVREDDNNRNTKIVQGSKRICDRRSLPLKASLPVRSVALILVKGTMDKLSVSKSKQRDNKATKNRSIIVNKLKRRRKRGKRRNSISLGFSLHAGHHFVHAGHPTHRKGLMS